ncbi:MAG TPA: hypothetical protein VMI31_19285, partial [Fimbriimonadaceae bacterium]|nr:hypothetical protein [Fimbriimonadaceae bacterium]
EPIPPDQAQSLLWELGERHFHGFSVVARDRRGFGGAQAAILVTARDSKGRIRRVALNCLDNDHGGGIDLRRLLECIWDSDAVAELGQYPADPSVRYSYYARGLEADRTILEAHGVTRLVGKNSGWTTLDEVLRSYQESVTAHRN